MSVQLRRRKLGSGKTSLYLDIYHEGQRDYEFLKLYLDPKDRIANKETLRLAESIRAKRQLELQSARHGFVPSFKKRANFVAYFESIAMKKKDKDWLTTLKHIKLFAGDTVPFSALTKQWLERFREHLLSQPQLCQNTARTYFSKLRAGIRIAFKDGMIDFNPVDLVDHIPAEETQRTYLTIDELRDLARTPIRHDYVKRAFLFSCYSGLRLGDIRRLRWDNISNGGIQFKQQKTGSAEYLPLNDQAKTFLGQPGERDEFVFPEFHKSNTTIEATLREWYEAANLQKHVTFHVARHTFATLALNSDVDLYTVSKLLGHKSVQVTQVYAKIIDKRKQEAVNRLPGIEI